MTPPGAPRTSDRPHVVIVGGGFAGLTAARSLRRAPVAVTLVDAHNHHLFQPLLYQVATAGLSPADIAAPIRKVLRRQRNALVLMARVTAVDLDRRVVRLSDGGDLAYDHLLLAPGATTHYFGRDDWRRHACGLKDVADALTIRQRLLAAYEAAEREWNPERRRRALTQVIVGGGPTGVELAGAFAEIARRTLSRDFRRFDPGESRILLVEAGDRLLPTYPEELSRSAERRLAAMGVDVRTGTRVTDIDATGVSLDGEHTEARTVVWAAGVRASPLVATLGVECDRSGRALVEDDLSIPGHPEVFVLGDAAAVRRPGGDWVPGLAPAAIQAGRHAAENVCRLIDGRTTLPFVYRDKGALATIGRSAAVADVAGLRLSGMPAWLLWIFVHVLFLIGFRNRVVVLLEWAWAWATFQRSARIIVLDADELGAGAGVDQQGASGHRRAEPP